MNSIYRTMTFFFVFSFSSNKSYSQSLNIVEMETMLKMSPPKLENYIVKKGYIYAGLQDDNTKSYYTGSESSPTNLLYSNGKILSFTTKIDNIYRSNIEQAEKLNYVFFKETNKNGIHGFSYKKSNLILMFFIRDNLPQYRFITFGEEVDIERLFGN